MGCWLAGGQLLWRARVDTGCGGHRRCGVHDPLLVFACAAPPSPAGHWGAGRTSDLSLLSAVKSAFPAQAIVLAETAYPWGGQEPAGSEFPYTPAGQASFIAALLASAHANGLAGVAWW